MFVALIVESDLNSTTRSMFVALIVESDLNSTTRSMFVALIVEKQVGNLSAHALQFARFKRKRLVASKYSNLIFERFIGVFSLVFSANQKIVNPLHCWEHEEGMRTFRG